MKASSASVRIPLTTTAVRKGFLPAPDPTAWRNELSKPDGTVVIELEGFGPIDGALDAERGVFRWRGWKKFYRLHDLTEEDAVVLTRRGVGNYHAAPQRARLLETRAPTVQSDNGNRGAAHTRSRTVPPDKRCNALDGRTWLQYSLSVWSDIRKSQDEGRLGHPAMFPADLAERLIAAFMRTGDRIVLDPFAGSGSTLVAARNLGKHGLGFEISPDYVRLAQERLSQRVIAHDGDGTFQIRQGDAATELAAMQPDTVDLCVTSPPYWDILNQKRSADAKAVRHYGNLPGDLGTIRDYDAFLDALARVFAGVLRVLRRGAYCCVVVMDLRKQDRFYPFHADLARRLQTVGFEFDDLIIWNRGHEYNNLRPLGYPYRFRVNKIHEYVLIFRRPVETR